MSRSAAVGRVGRRLMSEDIGGQEIEDDAENDDEDTDT
jgi:hypothetical protein